LPRPTDFVQVTLPSGQVTLAFVQVGLKFAQVSLAQCHYRLRIRRPLLPPSRRPQRQSLGLKQLHPSEKEARFPCAMLRRETSARVTLSFTPGIPVARDASISKVTTREMKTSHIKVDALHVSRDADRIGSKGKTTLNAGSPIDANTLHAFASALPIRLSLILDARVQALAVFAAASLAMRCWAWISPEPASLAVDVAVSVASASMARAALLIVTVVDEVEIALDAVLLLMLFALGAAGVAETAAAAALVLILLMVIQDSPM
jgi:hypothetical protein